MQSDQTHSVSSQATWHSIDHIDKLSEVKDAWNALLKLSGKNAIFNSYEWVENWLSRFWQPTWQLHLRYAKANDQVIAILPLYAQPSRYTWGLSTCLPLGQGEPEHKEVASEYQDLLVAPEWLAPLAPAITHFLSTTADHLRWRAIRTDSSLVACLPFYEKVKQATHTRYWLTPHSWQHAAMSKNFRAQRNRGLNKLKEHEYEFKWVPHHEIQSYFDVLINLHHTRWSGKGKTGAFSSKDFIDFHKKLITSSPWPKLSVLMIDNDVAAIHYYLESSNTLYFYQSGWDSQRYDQFSPGLLLHCWSIENTHNDVYDFMMGSQHGSYKARFKPMKTPLLNLNIPMSVKAQRLLKVKSAYKQVRTQCSNLLKRNR